MLLILAALAATIVPPTPDPGTVAEITRLETGWGQAFVKRDFAFIEAIVAPEYSLAGATPQGQIGFVHRDEWMRNARLWKHQGFLSHVAVVATAGDTAVATVEGLWTVKRVSDKPAEVVRFIVTDTWVKRSGKWQVIWRYSNRVPGAPWPPLPPKI